MNLENLKSLAKKHSKKKRARLMSGELLDVTRKLRSSGFTFSAIYNALKDEKKMPFCSFQTFYIAYKNR